MRAFFGVILDKRITKEDIYLIRALPSAAIVLLGVISWDLTADDVSEFTEPVMDIFLNDLEMKVLYVEFPSVVLLLLLLRVRRGSC